MEEEEFENTAVRGRADNKSGYNRRGIKGEDRASRSQWSEMRREVSGPGNDVEDRLTNFEVVV